MPVGNPLPPSLPPNLPPAAAAQIPNRAAPPLSLQLRGMSTPSQVIANMLQGRSAYPQIPNDPHAVPGFWQRVGSQNPQDMTPPKKRQPEEESAAY